MGQEGAFAYGMEEVSPVEGAWLRRGAWEKKPLANARMERSEIVFDVMATLLISGVSFGKIIVFYEIIKAQETGRRLKG